jgi:hypothetical protein
MTKGIRISQAGIPVSKAADYQKTMDERWPLLEHSFMGIIDIQQISTASEGVIENVGGTIAFVPVFKHGRGYLPAFRVKEISSVNFDTLGASVEQSLFADEQYIWLRVFKSPGVLILSVKFFLAVVDRDCTKEFQAPIDIITANQVTKPSTFGLKIKNNISAQGMREKNKKEYNLNTNGKSMAVQMHGVRTAGPSSVPAYNIIIDHRLGYPPTYYLAKKFIQTGAANPMAGRLMIEAMNAGRPLAALQSYYTHGISSSSSITMLVRGAQTMLLGDYMFIVLKDPVDTAK